MTVKETQVKQELGKAPKDESDFKITLPLSPFREYELGRKNPTHPLHNQYLKDKAIEKPLKFLRYGFYGNTPVVIIPLYNADGNIQTLQYILPNGKKQFLRGGKITDSFLPIKDLEREDHSFYLCEGFATAVSLQEILEKTDSCGIAVFCCNSGGIPNIAQMLQKSYPESNIICASDVDISGGEASRKCKELGIPSIFPPFSLGQKEKDWNDAVLKFSSEGELIDHFHNQIHEASLQKSKMTSENKQDEKAEEPEKVPERKPPHPFPFECLPDAFSGYAQELTEGLQVADAIVGSSFVSLSSLLCQDRGDVKTPFGEIPLSIFSLIVAESGERKSTVDKFVFKTVRQNEKELFVSYKERFDIYKMEEKVWKNEMEALIKAKAKNDELLEMQKQKPKEPIHPKILMQDPTIEGIYKQFHRGRRSLGLFSEEGGKMLGGYSMGKDREMASASSMSNFWDGKPLERTRAMDDNTMETLFDRRLATCLMVQPVIFEKSWKSTLLQNQGFLPRFLICMPEPKAGTRSYLDTQSIYFEHQETAESRIKELLNEQWRRQVNEEEPEEILVSSEANALFIEFYNSIERELDIAGKYYSIKAFASKCAEQALRLSAFIGLVDNSKEMMITADNFKKGSTLAKWYLDETLRILEDQEGNEENQNVLKVLEFLQAKKLKGVDGMTLREISQFLPSHSLRKKTTLLPILKELQEAKKIDLRDDKWVVLEC